MKKNFILLITLSMLCLAGCPESSTVETVEERPLRPVRYITLATEKQEKAATFSGTAVADRVSSLSFKVSGTVQKLHVKVGDMVHTGTLLAQLDKTDLQVDVKSARAGLKTAQADARSAQTGVDTNRSNYQRIQKLYEKDNVSLSEFEEARGNYETAQAQFQAANSRITTEKAKLSAAENQLRYTSLFAPFDGIINQKAVEEDEEISPGVTIFTLSGLGNLQVKINVSDTYITHIKKEMACSITFPALPKVPFAGIVTEVPYGVSDAPTYPVTIDIQAGDERLRPGMAAEAQFELGTPEDVKTLYIPADGVGEEGGQNFVFVIEDVQDNHGVARKRIVSLGSLTANGFLVQNGLKPGERVATSGLQVLLDKMKVKLLNDPIKEW